MERQLDELRAKMERSNLALGQFERDLDVVDPEDKSNILSSRLIQLNSEYTSAQIDRWEQAGSVGGHQDRLH